MKPNTLYAGDCLQRMRERPDARADLIYSTRRSTARRTTTFCSAAAYFSDNDPFEFEKWAVTRIHGFAPNTVQRGDGGIDDRALIWNGEAGRDLCIAQVKRGKPSVDALRAFYGKVAIDLFITLRKQKPTPTVTDLIASAGYIEVGGKQFHRLVTWGMAGRV